MGGGEGKGRGREDEGRSGTRRNTGGAPVGIALAY